MSKVFCDKCDFLGPFTHECRAATEWHDTALKPRAELRLTMASEQNADNSCPMFQRRRWWKRLLWWYLDSECIDQ